MVSSSLVSFSMTWKPRYIVNGMLTIVRPLIPINATCRAIATRMATRPKIIVFISQNVG